MSNPILLYTFALIACISSVTALPLKGDLPLIGNLPDWLLGGGGQSSPVVGQCGQGIRNVEGCVQELISSFLSLRPNIGPACCKAFMDLDETCLPKLFPFHLDFLPRLKDNCGGGNDSPPPPPPPPSPCSDDENEGCGPPPPPPPSPCSDDEKEGCDPPPPPPPCSDDETEGCDPPPSPPPSPPPCSEKEGCDYDYGYGYNEGDN